MEYKLLDEHGRVTTGVKRWDENAEQIAWLQKEEQKHDEEIREYVRKTNAKQRRLAYISIALALLAIVLALISMSGVYQSEEDREQLHS